MCRLLVCLLQGLADHFASLPQNREMWGFSYYAVIWKVLEDFIAILKISLKLKANQLPKHTCSSKMFWEVSLKQLKKNSPKLSEIGTSVSLYSEKNAFNK